MQRCNRRVRIGHGIGQLERGTHHGQERVEIRGDEIGILEVSQEPKVAYQADNEPQSPHRLSSAAVHEKDHEVIDCRSAEQK